MVPSGLILNIITINHQIHLLQIPPFFRGFLPELAAAGAIDRLPVLEPPDGGGGGASSLTHQLGTFIHQDPRFTRELWPGDAGWD